MAKEVHMVEEEQVTITCDDCSKEILFLHERFACFICEKDLCSQHVQKMWYLLAVPRHRFVFGSMEAIKVMDLCQNCIDDPPAGKKQLVRDLKKLKELSSRIRKVVGVGGERLKVQTDG